MTPGISIPINGRLTNTANLWDEKYNSLYQEGSAKGFRNATDILRAVQEGKIDPLAAQLYLSSGTMSYKMSEEQEKLFNNLLANYNSRNETLWQAEQLQALGLANSGVLQTGGVHTAQDYSNVATNKANRLASVANSFINMAGRMGSAGIHGAALSAVKGAASSAASTLAHSATSAMSKPMTTKEEQELLAFFDGR